MEVGEDGELAVHDPTGQADCRLFRFDKVFGEGSTQQDVYEDTQPLVRSVLDGEECRVPPSHP
jgi:kinesin family protein C2/C3